MIISYLQIALSRLLANAAANPPATIAPFPCRCLTYARTQGYPFPAWGKQEAENAFTHIIPHT